MRIAHMRLPFLSTPQRAFSRKTTFGKTTRDVDQLRSIETMRGDKPCRSEGKIAGEREKERPMSICFLSTKSNLVEKRDESFRGLQCKAVRTNLSIDLPDETNGRHHRDSLKRKLGRAFLRAIIAKGSSSTVFFFSLHWSSSDIDSKTSDAAESRTDQLVPAKFILC